MLKDPLVFRAATESDIAAMSVIRLSVTENVLSDPGKITVAMYRDHLGPIGRTWVAELDGAVIGFCSADHVRSSIWALFIDPGHEGRGAAKALLKLATEWLFSRGNSSVTLGTGPDTRADKFYAAQGWQRQALEGAKEVEYTLRAPARSAL
jgi:GNAT superfamily N-acetyltransferase